MVHCMHVRWSKSFLEGFEQEITSEQRSTPAASSKRDSYICTFGIYDQMISNDVLAVLDYAN